MISCTIDIRVPVTFKKDDILNRIEGNLEDKNGRALKKCVKWKSVITVVLPCIREACLRW